MPFPTLGDLSGPETDPSPGSPAPAGRFFATGAPWESPIDNVKNNTIILIGTFVAYYQLVFTRTDFSTNIFKLIIMPT